MKFVVCREGWKLRKRKRKVKLLNRRESCCGLCCLCKEERVGEKIVREIIVIVIRVFFGVVKLILLIFVCVSYF